MHADPLPALAGLTVATIGAPATSNPWEAIILSVLTLAVRELFAWLNRRNRP